MSPKPAAPVIRSCVPKSWKRWGNWPGGVAHDFNNVLTTIVGACHLAALDAPKGSDLAHEIDQIGIAARRAQHLVRELLTFARREPSDPVPVAIADVIDEVALLLRASLPPVTTLDVRAPDSPLAVMGDATHLHQIIMNLCRNAVEAMAGQTGTIAMSVAASDPPPGADAHVDRWVRVTVSDTGPGMSTETLEHLFEPFFTTKPLGKGSGLGLAVVLGLVEGYGRSHSGGQRFGQGHRVRCVPAGHNTGAWRPLCRARGPAAWQ